MSSRAPATSSRVADQAPTGAPSASERVLAHAFVACASAVVLGWLVALGWLIARVSW